MSLGMGGVLLNCHPTYRSCPGRSWKGGVVLASGRIDFPFISSFPLLAKPRSFHPRSRGGFHVGAFLFDPTRDPIIKDALKEPVAFMGGMFAGILRLDLKEDPLREWISRTAEAAGITDEEEDETGGDMLQEESPREIEIE